MNKVKAFFVKIWSKIKGFFKKLFGKEGRDDSHYLSRAEQKNIAKYNRAITKEYEKNKARKNVPESEYLSQMKDPNNVVEFDDLHTYFFTDAGTVKAVDGVSFNIPRESIVGVVGESGCGKSVTSLSLMQLVQRPTGQIYSGEIRFASTDGKVYDIAKMPTEKMNKIRGKQISMIFQEPMTSLNPVFKIGEQLDEVTLLHVEGATKEMAKQKSLEMLELVGIPMAENVYNEFPHELSGGMRQRVMIAMALACNPSLIIADEPTTALDVTIQAQILDLLRDIKNKINGSIMLITHDLGVIAEMADYVVVMYAGRIVEQGTAHEIFLNPKHPYTIGLQKSKPAVNKHVDRLYSIPGSVPNPVNMPNYCYFRDRCNMRTKVCDGDYPNLINLSESHKVSCHLYSQVKNEEEK
jgi:peptide/nickel transport system ATP-binding protein